MELTQEEREDFIEALSEHGLRLTKQREHVFAVLLDQRDHPTVDEVYNRAQSGIPSISLATVYNCLESLVACGLVKQVNIEREPSRYCPNLAPHAHFHCGKTGRVYDIAVPRSVFNKLKAVLPAGYDASTVELSFRGKKNK